MSVEKYLKLLFKPLRDNMTNSNSFSLFLSVKLLFYDVPIIPLSRSLFSSSHVLFLAAPQSLSLGKARGKGSNP